MPEIDNTKIGITGVSSDSANTDTFSFNIPENAKKFYISFTDSNGNKSSTTLINVK